MYTIVLSFRFSARVLNSVMSFLHRNAGNCLKRTDHGDSWNTPDLNNYITSNLLGQQYSIHRQCVHIMGSPNSYACLVSTRFLFFAS